MKTLVENIAAQYEAFATNATAQVEKNNKAAGTRARKAALELKAKLDKVVLNFQTTGGADGRLYGSVTAKDIAEQLSRAIGTEVDKRKIVLKDSIRAYGRYNVVIKILGDITASFIVIVSE